MRQESAGLLSGKSAAYLCKIAWKSIPTWGITALAILSAGFFFLVSSGATLGELHDMGYTSCLMSAQAESRNPDLNVLTDLEGVEAVTPVIRQSAVLTLGEDSLECEILAVSGSFLDLTFAEGKIFPDESNMPFLILNEAAVKSLSGYGQNSRVTVGNSIKLRQDGMEEAAVICGIYRDGSEIPAGYRSYGTAGKTTQDRETTELLIRLTGFSKAENVAALLASYGISARVDSVQTLRWSAAKTDLWQRVALSLCFLVCGQTVTRLQTTARREQEMERLEMLRMAGMTEGESRLCLPLRVLAVEAMCFAAGCLASAALGAFSPIGMVMGFLWAGLAPWNSVRWI